MLYSFYVLRNDPAVIFKAYIFLIAQVPSYIFSVTK